MSKTPSVTDEQTVALQLELVLLGEQSLCENSNTLSKKELRANFQLLQSFRNSE